MLAHNRQVFAMHRFRRYPIDFTDLDEAVNRAFDRSLIDDIHIKHDLQADAV